MGRKFSERGMAVLSYPLQPRGVWSCLQRPSAAFPELKGKTGLPTWLNSSLLPGRCSTVPQLSPLEASEKLPKLASIHNRPKVLGEHMGNPSLLSLHSASTLPVPQQVEALSRQEQGKVYPKV